MLFALATLLLSAPSDVHVRIESDVPVQVTQVTSSRIREGFTYPGELSPETERIEKTRPFCIAPCERTVPHEEAQLPHHVGGGGVAEGTFSFGDSGPAVIVRIKAGSAVKRSQGKGLTSFGGVVTGVSAIAALLGALVPQQRPYLWGGAVLGGAGGIACLVAGILLLVKSTTRIEVEHDDSYEPPPEVPVPEPQPVPML
jgi:hypothetical protein